MQAIQGSLGVFSLVLLFFGFAAWGLTRQVGFFVVFNLAIGLFTLIAYLASGRQRVGTFLGERSTRYGANAILYSAFFIGVIAMLNFLAARYEKRIDTSETGVFSLAEQSKKVVAKLPKDLEMIGFVEGGSDAGLDDLLKSYTYASERVKYRIVDPDKNPDLAERYKITEYNTLRIAYGDNATVVSAPDEQKITNAIIKVTGTGQKKICFVEGHGEPDVEDAEGPRGFGALKTALENENFGVQKVLLATQEKMPSDCSAVVVPAPSKPYFPPEIKMLEAYLGSGGRALFLFEAQKGDELIPLVTQYGVQVGNDVVVDQVLRLFQGPQLGIDPITNTYGTHAITQGLGTERTMFHLARTISAAEPAPEGAQVTPLVQTSASSWAEADVAGLFKDSKVSLDPATDKKGPLSIAVATTASAHAAADAQPQPSPAPDSSPTPAATPGAAADAEPAGKKKEQVRLVVFGSSDFVNNRMLQSFFNRDLILNSIAWTVGEEDAVAIRPRSLRASRVQLTDAEVQRIFYLSVLLLPELLLLAGISVWAQRRGA
ncbi:MAG: gliding motility-associatede transport system auxiliary component [Candidatus Binatota bacterium]|nr:gliding motility-associatede transport system auxiliary component [Candidatus Binatota bacterium]